MEKHAYPIRLEETTIKLIRDLASYTGLSQGSLISVAISKLEKDFENLGYNFKKRPDSDNLLKDLKNLSRKEEAHLEKEFAGYEKAYPKK